MITVLTMKIEELHANLRLASHKLYGQSSEQSQYVYDSIESRLQELKKRDGMIQGNIFTDVLEDLDGLQERADESNSEEEKSSAEKEDTPEDAPKRKAYKGRNKRFEDMSHLEVVEHHHGEDLTHCSSCETDSLKEMSMETVKELDIIPAKFIINHHITHKYICSQCNGITRGDKPCSPLTGCMASAALLTHICHSRFDLYIPYYRLNRDFKTYGLDISDSNLCNWMNHLSEDVMHTLYLAIKASVLSANEIYCDETVLKEMAKNKCKTKYIWEYINTDVKNVVFEYSDRSRENPSEFLKDFRDGYLITDKYSGYDEICKRNNLIRCFCWAHARRKFHEIIKSSKDPNELIDIKYIHKLIDEMLNADKKIRRDHPNEIVKRRATDVAPLIDTIYKEIETLKEKHPLIKGSLAKAIKYLLGAPEEFKNFLKNSKVEPTNNISERTFRFITLGRKNWLFAGSARGGRTVAVISTIIASARMNDLNIREYLLHIIKNLPDSKLSRVNDFLPQNCLQFQNSADK